MTKNIYKNYRLELDSIFLPESAKYLKGSAVYKEINALQTGITFLKSHWSLKSAYPLTQILLKKIN